VPQIVKASQVDSQDDPDGDDSDGDSQEDEDVDDEEGQESGDDGEDESEDINDAKVWSYTDSWKRWVRICDNLPSDYLWPTMSKNIADGGLSEYWAISSESRFDLSSSECICLMEDDPDRPPLGRYGRGRPSAYTKIDRERNDQCAAEYRHLELPQRDGVDN
jgi:hypothetical protein